MVLARVLQVFTRGHEIRTNPRRKLYTLSAQHFARDGFDFSDENTKEIIGNGNLTLVICYNSLVSLFRYDSQIFQFVNSNLGKYFYFVFCIYYFVCVAIPE